MEKKHWPEENDLAHHADVPEGSPVFAHSPLAGMKSKLLSRKSKIRSRLYASAIV